MNLADLSRYNTSQWYWIFTYTSDTRGVNPTISNEISLRKIIIFIDFNYTRICLEYASISNDSHAMWFNPMLFLYDNIKTNQTKNRKILAKIKCSYRYAISSRYETSVANKCFFWLNVMYCSRHQRPKPSSVRPLCCAVLRLWTAIRLQIHRHSWTTMSDEMASGEWKTATRAAQTRACQTQAR